MRAETALGLVVAVPFLVVSSIFLSLFWAWVGLHVLDFVLDWVVDGERPGFAPGLGSALGAGKSTCPAPSRGAVAGLREVRRSASDMDGAGCRH